MKTVSIVVASAILFTRCHAFLSYFNQADPVLQTLGVDVKGELMCPDNICHCSCSSRGIKDAQLNIRLDIGTVEGIGINGTPKMGGNRLGIDGLVVQLLPFKEDYKHPQMPGSDGPHPQLSSGTQVCDESLRWGLISSRYQCLSNLLPLSSLWQLYRREVSLTLQGKNVPSC